VKVIYYFVAALCIAVSLMALLHTIYWNVLPIIYLFAINGVVVAVMWRFLKKTGLATMSALLYIAILWPGIGPLLLYLVSFASKDLTNEGERLRDYEKYIEGLHRVQGVHVLSAADVEAEVNIMAGGDVIRFATSTYKKEFIIKTKGQDLPRVAGVLNMALRDDDPEVRHYASTIMAALIDACEKDIQALKDKVRREPALLLPLSALYDRYISSGLMATEIKREFAKEQLSILWQSRQLFPDNYDVAVKLFDALIKQSMYAEARQLLPDIAESFPGLTFPLLLEMQLEFLQGNYQRVAAIAQKIREADWAVPATYKHVVDYWS